MSVIDILERAQARIRNGWTQGTYGPREGPNCIMGAIMHEADPYSEEGNAARRALIDAVAQMGYDYDAPPVATIASFNDDPNHTQQDAINLFDVAIELVKKGS